LGSGIDPAGSTAKRPKVLDANAGRRTLFRRRGEGRRLPGARVVWVEVRAPAPVARLVDRPGWAVGHSFAARGGMECCDCRHRGGRGQSKGATAPYLPGVMTAATRAHHRSEWAHAGRGVRAGECTARA
jgi:hypothetical protein